MLQANDVNPIDTPATSTPDPRSWKKERVASIASEFAPSVDLPIRYFVFALAALALFAVSLPFFSTEVLAQHHYTHRTVAFTHLLVLGWIASVILGATVQIVPVALGVAIHSEKLVRWTFILHVLGVLGMVTSFWLWNFRLLLWFGMLVTAGFSLFIYNIVRTLRRVKQHDIVSAHIAASLGYLALTFLAGQYLMHDKVSSFSPFSVISAIHAHAHLAALGWLFMMIVGVSYRLIPMFALTSIQCVRRAWISFILLNLGTLGIFITVLTRSHWTGLAALVVVSALGLWAWELIAMLRMRMRPHLDGTLRQTLIAMGHLPVLAALGLWMSQPVELTALKAQAQTSYGLIALLGFVTLFIMGMLYKIIPFLVWYKIFPPLVGRQPVPKLYELYSLRLQRWSLGLFLAGLWATALLIVVVGDSVAAGWLSVTSAIMGCGILIFVVNMGMPLARLVKLPRIREPTPLDSAHPSVAP